MSTINTQQPIVVIGGGMVGAATALTLSQLSLPVVLVETRDIATCDDNQQPYALRVSAIQRSSEQLLKSLGAWPYIEQRRYLPFVDMVVQDWQGFHTRLSAQDIHEDNLGYMIENDVVTAAIWQALKAENKVELRQSKLIFAQHNGIDQWQLTFSDGQKLTTSLLIGADGANSQVAQLMNVSKSSHDYQQKCIVGVVNTEHDHQHACWQHYRPEGPFALLPLTENTCSIAWYVPSGMADNYLQQNSHEQAAAMTAASANMLGQLTPQSQLAAFPLIQKQSQRYVQANTLLIGDAAHTIHPQAGQGVNLGLLDVAALQLVLKQAIARQQPIGDIRVLQRYERMRRHDASLMQYGMLGFNHLFADQQITNGLRQLLQPLAQLAPLRRIISAQGLYGRLTAHHFMQSTRS